jgi:hypothetical protein
LIAKIPPKKTPGRTPKQFSASGVKVVQKRKTKRARAASITSSSSSNATVRTRSATRRLFLQSSGTKAPPNSIVSSSSDSSLSDSADSDAESDISVIAAPIAFILPIIPVPIMAVQNAPMPNVKLPAFIESNVKQWLNIADFSMAGFDERIRYSAVVRHLPSHVSIELADVINRHSEAAVADWPAFYVEFKQLLVSRYSESDRSAIQKLLSTAQRGGQKPSMFLRKLRSLVDGRNLECEAIIHNCFINNLPNAVRTALMTRGDEPLDKLADLADAMCEVCGDSASLSAVISGELLCLRLCRRARWNCKYRLSVG